MAIDGILIKHITNELKEKLIGGRIQKIYQINDHLITINIYNKENYNLLISSNPQNARIHLTNQTYDHPEKATNFSMILRKHLQNSIIKEINQISLDRSIEIVVDSKDELGLNIDKKIMIDIMGKYSNIVLVNEENKVIEAIKRISHEMSSVRAVYPGTIFNQLEDDKINILNSNKDLYDIDLDDNYKLKRVFYSNFTGFGPQISNEIIFLSNIDSSKKIKDLTKEEFNLLNNNFKNIREIIRNNNFDSFIYKKDEKIEDFYCIPLSYLGYELEKTDSISKALDLYYKQNVNDNSLNQAKSNLKSILTNRLSRLQTKLENLELDYSKSKDYDKYRIEGDQLSTVAYKINKGDESVEVEDFETGNKNTIKLNPKKSPWENIELKYKKSKKLHRSNEILKKSIPSLKDDINYNISLINQLKNIDNKDELDEVKEELMDQNIIKSKKSNKKNKKKNKENIRSKPHQFITSNNNIIYVGKNNKQNELLTLRKANPEDYFFHIKDLPGSHVILKTDHDIDDNDIYAASYLAAFYSKNNNDRYIDVDYTEKKNVNKAKGSKPGMVYYTNFNTIRIDLEDKPTNINKQ